MYIYVHLLYIYIIHKKFVIMTASAQKEFSLCACGHTTTSILSRIYTYFHLRFTELIDVFMYINTCIYICQCKYTHICIYVDTHTVYIYIYIHIYMCVIYIYIYMHV